ncbi:MAG: c-type cytochrome [Caldilineae bacterium]|nr:c-type cytochrome [Chloroflexota bacterium]MCB9176893.1 c-type cytochrome [Caldilineae bacterium]
MITRVEITLGLLSLLGVIAITALVGVGEFGDNGRMLRAEVGYDSRSVESGAQMFNQYCAPCHGINAAGLNCPTLDETSGLHGGDLAEGVAWRLEEVNWNRNDPYGYVFSTIAAGRTLSTRPDRYPAQDPKNMAMPAWSQHYGGPLREDQIKDIANYVVNFRSYFPETSDPEAGVKACEMALATIKTSIPGYVSACYEKLGRKPPTVAPTARPTVEATPSATGEAGEGTATADDGTADAADAADAETPEAEASAEATTTTSAAGAARARATATP